jgi:hypothetical protein
MSANALHLALAEFGWPDVTWPGAGIVNVVYYSTIHDLENRGHSRPQGQQ